MPTVLVILAEQFEEIEALTPIDLLRRAEVDVTLASLGDTTLVTGRSGVAVRADTTFADAAKRDYDCLVLPGGPGTKLLRADPRVRDCVLRHHAAGRLVAAICAAPAVLHDAGLLAGRRYTAHFSVGKELPHILSDERTVEDGRIITSRGAGTALDFALLLVEHLTNPGKAREIARSICA